MPVFKRRVDAKIAQAAKGRRVQTIVTKEAQRKVELAKASLMSDIDNDPSSIMIETDPEVIGYFGFDTDDQPVDNLKFVIENRIGLNPRPKREKSSDGISYKYNIKYPSRREVYSEGALNLPWISQTWVQKLEEGIGNIEQFLFFAGRGRSEFGIQGRPSKKGKKLNDRAEPRDAGYLDRIRNDFAKNLRRNF